MGVRRARRSSSTQWKLAAAALDEQKRQRGLRVTRAKVLVAEDDPDIRLTLRQVLRDEGFAVLEAKNGLEAREIVAEENPDVVLLDLMMPLVNGWDVLKTLRNARQDLPLIILSAVPLEGEPARGVDGIVDYVVKPISWARLLHLISTIDECVKARGT